MLPAARIWLLFFLTKEEIYVKTSKTTSYPANRPFSLCHMFLSTLFSMPIPLMLQMEPLIIRQEPKFHTGTIILPA